MQNTKLPAVCINLYWVVMSSTSVANPFSLLYLWAKECTKPPRPPFARIVGLTSCNLLPKPKTLKTKPYKVTAWYAKLKSSLRSPPLLGSMYTTTDQSYWLIFVHYGVPWSQGRSSPNLAGSWKFLLINYSWNDILHHSDCDSFHFPAEHNSKDLPI